MKITRLYSGTDGESHFDEVEVNLFSSGSGLVMSKPFKAKNVCIKADNGNCDVPWHNHPNRFLTAVIEGEVEMEVRDGTKRRFNVGDIFLDEDTTGRGHLTRAVNGKPHMLFQVELD
jgi:quercetin dioxygenase-like cupin family protein